MDDKINFSFRSYPHIEAKLQRDTFLAIAKGLEKNKQKNFSRKIKVSENQFLYLYCHKMVTYLFRKSTRLG